MASTWFLDFAPRRRGMVMVWTLGLAIACGSSGGSGGAGSGGSGGAELGDGSASTTGGGGLAGHGTPCDSTHPCTALGALCVDGECKSSSGSCMSNADCQGDTHCCTTECMLDPSTQGRCVPNSGQNQACRGTISAGVFSPTLQCEWKTPPDGDPYPDRRHVLTTPLVADLPNDSGGAAEIIIVASNDSTGGQGSDTSSVIRILNGQTCAQDEVIADSLGARDPAPPAIADLDRDGKLEIVARMNDGTIAAFHWDDMQKKFVKWWRQSSLASGGGRGGRGGRGNDWAGVSIYDLDDDGYPEVVAQGGQVFDGRAGTPLNPNQSDITLSSDPAVGDVDGDGKPDLLAANGVFRWDTPTKSWLMAYPGANGSGATFFAYADFGTPGALPADFNAKALDGVAEIVATGGGSVAVYTLAGQEIMKAPVDRGGPPTIGDFDHDGFPDIAVADGEFFRVFDLKCKGMPAGCAGDFIRWVRPSQDKTSGETGSTTFDFEGDGKQEAIYADECFVRVYDGASGAVLFSAWRSSCTWWEYPVAADVNKDTHTKIVVNSNPNCAVACPVIDPIDPGVRCLTNDDCFSRHCDAGFCRCTTDAECGEINPMSGLQNPGSVDGGLRCEPVLAGTAGAGNVCRMTHPQVAARVDREAVLSGVRVVRDRLDRWASSRPLWNQHAYNITHINDDGTTPRTSEWKQNFRQPGLNNFRANVQGPGGVDDLPDITGALDKTGVCAARGATVTLTGKVCNRGFRVVGAAMPATFYLGPVSDGKILCVSRTSGPVPIGDACLPVSCTVDATVPSGSTITMVVNDDGLGHATTVECDARNNTDSVTIDACAEIN